MTDYKDLLGKPFVDFGRGPNGFDCWGLVIEVGKSFGIEYPDYGQVHRAEVDRIDGIFNSEEGRSYTRVSSPMAGDLVVFRKIGKDHHFGIMVSSHEFLHVQADGMGVSGASIHHPIYSRLIEGFYRWAQ